MSVWDSIRESFVRTPNAKGMTYLQHVGDGLWSDVHVGLYGAGKLVHTFFPMVCGSCERLLRLHLLERLQGPSAPTEAAPEE